MPQIENVTKIKLKMTERGHPNEINHERKKDCNEGIQATLSKGIEKTKEDSAGRIHQTDGLPQEIRRQFIKRKAGKTSHSLYEWQTDKNQAGEKKEIQQKK